ncbi:D-alanyl-D-alanine carboxypeptidase [Streptomyces sp. bgisy091]|uniref:D-alanyl-D-alanine carboxypeptidase family protein n=1 Tax=Streptomyces sp. bgisy091 TaxID=3413778 RepID=UPI003D72EB6A
MAGESPDKSEQRKSSGTAEERDPRFAVFREPTAGAGGKTEGGTTGAVTDTETAVFRLPDSGSSDAPEGDAERESAPESLEGASEASGEAEGATEPRDAAGAAAGAPQASEGEDTAEAVDAAVDPEPEAEPAADVADAEASDAEPAASAQPTASDADDRSEGEAGPDAGDDSDADGGASGDAADSEAGPEHGSGAEPTPTDARLRDVVAAWVATGPEGETTDAEADGEVRDAADQDGDEGDRPTGGADENRAEAEASDSVADPATDAGDVAEDVAEAAASADDASPVEAGSDGAAEAPGGRTADDTDTDSDTEAEAPVDTDTDTATDSDTDAAADPDSDADTADEAVPAAASGSAVRVPKTREESSPAEQAEKSAQAGKAAEAESAEDAGSEEDEDAEPVGDGRGIDHPTAVFKAVRADQIDHPTTALKLPARTTAEAEKTEAPRKPASWGAKPSGAAPEAPAERTSKFVPLRSDDVRPEPVVGPTVTPDVTSGGPAAGSNAGAGLTEAERTRQQPMPPKPPLDLLAELTNTPPPPETPVRTAVRRVKIWTPLVLLALIIFAIAQSVRPLPDPALTLTASPTYTFGGEKLDMPWPAEGQGAVEVEGVGAIGSYGKEKSAPIASMAKVMTAYVILKGHPITGKQTGEQIAVDKRAGEEASLEDESRVAIEEGQKYSEHQMLEMLMIPSGNNVARLLARWDAGTEKAFVEKMNQAAEDLGMTNSTYTDPSGLKSSTVSTPADQIKLGKAVMQSDVFREIVNQPQADIPNVGRIYNNNYILLEPGVSGIKTGSSTPAGGNLLWTADTVVDGKSRRIIGAVMGATLDGTLDAKLERARQNSLKLIQAAQRGVDSAAVVKKGQVVGYVDNGFGGQTPLVATKDLKAVGWGGLEVDVELTDGGKVPAHQADAGTVVGEVSVGSGTGKVSVPVALQSAMTEPGFGDKLTRIT